MLRTCILMGAGLLAVLGVGCAGGEKRDPEFELRKAEQEKSVLTQRLTDEQAKSVALQKRIEVEQTEWQLNRNKVASLRDELTTLTQRYDELKKIIDERKNRPLDRPAVPAAALPDELDQALQKLAGKYADRVWYDRSRGAVSFANDRLFDAGSDVVRAEALPGLQELAGVLTKAPADEFELIVVGHTDETPISKPETLAKHPSNWHLSVHRAIAVQQVLMKAGLPASRFGVMGYAEYRPVGTDPAQNRRVEVFVARNGGAQPLAPVRPAAGRR